MTLKEKFETKSSIDTKKEAKVFASECEKIADEFAVGFAEWYFKKAEKYDSYLKLKKDSKELLEIYKKEQEL
jgi:hypothetical protein